MGAGLLDSGSDATVLPTSFLAAGVEIEEDGPMLQDAHKSVCFVFEAENDKKIQVFGKAHFSSGISQPILSSGRLMESGWELQSILWSMALGRERDQGSPTPAKQEPSS